MTLDELLSLFKRDIHPQLRAALKKPGIKGLSVYENAAGQRRAVPAIPHAPIDGGESYRLAGTYWVPDLEMSGSRTQEALNWLREDPSRSVRQASIKFKISRQSIMRGRDRRVARVICPCCSQVVREGFTLRD